jgi:hypothetical protein
MSSFREAVSYLSIIPAICPQIYLYLNIRRRTKVNSEELEASLRTEFESYLKEIFVEMRQELAQLQEKVATEIERHKSTLDETFNDVMSRVETDKQLDASFRDSVTEHLRLSRDEGARITAMAIAEAEEMEKQSAPPVAFVAPLQTGIKEIHEAIIDISSKKSQPEILKSLVHHAANFAPRGAFFILKNEHLVGWRVFGKDKSENEEKIREVFLSVSADSILSNAVKSLETVESSVGTSNDADILNKLEFGEPQNMVAVPLVARGRGVAVLYADQASAEDAGVNIEALQTLTRVAGLTVEVLASAKTPAQAKKETVKKPAEFVEESSIPVEETATHPAEFVEESLTPVEETEHSEHQESSESSYQAVSDYQTPVYEPAVEPVADSVEPVVENEEAVVEPSYQTSFDSPVVTSDLEEEPVKEEVSEEEIAKEETLEEEPVAYSFDSNDYQVEEIKDETPAYAEEKYSTDDSVTWSQPVEDTSWKSSLDTTQFSAQEYAENFAKETDPTEYAKDFAFQSPVESTDSVVPSTNEYQFETTQSDFQIEKPKDDFFSNYDSTPTEPIVTEEEKFSAFETENAKTEPFTESFEAVSQPVESFTAPAESFAAPVETVSQPISTPAKTRLSERNVDLPIEVSEDERRLHNDARRFARLLVSEIKLYNEQKVKEGRDSSDIYERLREAIDRSREMYDKRVQPPVAAKFDYFHYELLNTLAEGDENKLGVGYPGAAV